MNITEAHEMALMENTLMNWNLSNMQQVRIEKIKENYQM